MTKLIHCLKFFFLFLILSFTEDDFKKAQLKNSRVKTAYSEKQNICRQLLKNNSIDTSKFEVLLRIFKHEKELELWAKNKNAELFKLIKTYPICERSGDLGPKRKAGDMQTPEGFYFINRFNPASNFYLSLGVNYPNKSDKYFSAGANTGGDIFIHGNCVTIGCIPITDDLIKELYLFCIEAYNGGEMQIPVYIFPIKMNNTNYTYLTKNYFENKTLLKFWENIKIGYDKFEKDHILLKTTISDKGIYQFN